MKSLIMTNRQLKKKNAIALSLITAMRPLQWSKNILIFLPPLMAHTFFESDNLSKSFLAFITFSFMASAIYIINDISDIENDRLHPVKKNRPFASGKIPTTFGFFLSASLILLSLLMAFILSKFVLSNSIFILIGIYFAITTIYTFILKKMVIIDIMTLAFFYIYRVFVGSIVTSTPLSKWLVLFCSFLFLGLAILKRYIEIRNLEELNGKANLGGRSYSHKEKNLLFVIGLIASHMTILTFALFIKDPILQRLYQSPVLLWFSAPLLYYWNVRMWLLAERNHINTDPVLFTMKDKNSYIIGIIIFLIFVAARFSNTPESILFSSI